MKKNVLNIVLLLFALLLPVINANAAIESKRDIIEKTYSLGQIVDADVNSFMSKSELIGDRLEYFNMLTKQYKNQVYSYIQSLESIVDKVELVETSQYLTNEEKSLQTFQLYKEADKILFNVDAGTTTYLYSVKKYLPTVTYQKYTDKYRNFYNELHITDK